MEIIDLLPTSLSSSEQDLQQILSSFSEHKVFMRKGSNVNSIVTHINNLLNSNDNHPKGVLLLHSFLPQCSPSLFAEHGFFWIQQCLKSTEQDDTVVVLEFQTLGDLFVLSADLIDLRKNVVNTLLPKFFDKLDGKGSKQVRAAKMKCLVNVMTHYAGACGLRRGIIDKFIQKSLKLMRIDDREWLSVTCKCYLLLAQCGGSGSQGSVHKENWSQQFQVLINSAHAVLDLLFDSVSEIQLSKTPSVDGIDKKLGVLESIPSFENPVSRYNFYSSLFCKIMKLLQIMLLGAFPAPKSVTPVALFNVICRGLAVTCITVSKKSLTLDKIALISVLPFVHVELLNSLDALIRCCTRNLIPYASLICKLACQSLKWTSEEWEYSCEKPYQSVRVATYNVFQSWLNCARLASGIEPFTVEILELIEKDFKYDKPSIKLQNKNQDPKEKRKKLSYTQDEEIEKKDPSKMGSLTCNKNICYKALNTLQQVLQSASTSLTATQLKNLQTNIIKLLLDIQSSNGVMPIPYADPSCRLQLYRTLHFIVMESHSDISPPTAHAALIFTKGLLDNSQQVSAFCAEVLSSIEKIIHPICNSLYFPNEAPNYNENPLRNTSVENMDLDTSQAEISPADISNVSESLLSRSHNLTPNSNDATRYSLATSPEINLSTVSSSETTASRNQSPIVLKKTPKRYVEILRQKTGETSSPRSNISSSDSSICSISSVTLNPNYKGRTPIVEKNGSKSIISSPEVSSVELESPEPTLKKQKTIETEPASEIVVNEESKEFNNAEIASDNGELEDMLADFVDVVRDENNPEDGKS